MTIEIKVPALPDSVADATVATWHKKTGDAIEKDEVIVELETDKVVLEVPATSNGILGKIEKEEGTTVLAGELLGSIEEGAAPAKAAEEKEKSKENSDIKKDAVSAAPTQIDASPSVRQMIAENNLSAADITGTGKGGKITKEDVEKHLSDSQAKTASKAAKNTAPTLAVSGGSRAEKREPMTRMRAKISERLLKVKHETAMLTTFNEVDMKAVMDLRKQYKDKFLKDHDVKLGFMSFFTKACAEALKLFPAVNASIDGSDIVYHGYCDIGIAVSSQRGLVVPVLRNAENMSMSDIEQNITDYAVKARAGKLTLEEMTGGTFTITNGGVFGSLLSTPIINLPQSSILGMHKIQDRPMAVNGKVEILPMMYLALSYDHRQIDGKESVGFLVTIKELLEDPTRLLLDV